VTVNEVLCVSGNGSFDDIGKLNVIIEVGLQECLNHKPLVSFSDCVQVHGFQFSTPMTSLSSSNESRFKSLEATMAAKQSAFEHDHLLLKEVLADKARVLQSCSTRFFHLRFSAVPA